MLLTSIAPVWDARQRSTQSGKTFSRPSGHIPSDSFQRTQTKPPSSKTGAVLFGMTHQEQALHNAAEQGNLQQVNHLLTQQGVNPNAADEHGQTALMQAAKNGHANVAQFLLQHGADVNQADPTYQSTALDYAVFQTENTHDPRPTIRVLLEHHARILPTTVAPTRDLLGHMLRDTCNQYAEHQRWKDELLLEPNTEENTVTLNQVNAALASSKDFVRLLMMGGVTHPDIGNPDSPHYRNYQTVVHALQGEMMDGPV